MQCGMQMHLLFCRPFECLMSARKQNSTPPFHPLHGVSISRSTLSWSARRRKARPDGTKVNEVKKVAMEEHKDGRLRIKMHEFIKEGLSRLTYKKNCQVRY